MSRALAAFGIAAAAASAFFAEGTWMAAGAVDRSPCNDEACAFDIVWAILIPGFLSLLAFGIVLVASSLYFSGRRPEAGAAVACFLALAVFEHWVFL